MATSTRANESNTSSSPDSSTAKSSKPESFEPPEPSKPATSGSKPQPESLKPEPEPPSERETSASPPKPNTKVTRELTPVPVETVSIESILDREDIVDKEILAQILELDEPDNHEFSIGMTWAYFEQAKNTFVDMRVALDAEDLPKLSSLGHFLKGSSAALGTIKVRESCEQIQHYGDLRDEGANKSLTKKEALEKVGNAISKVQEEYDEAEQWLRKYYEVNAPNETTPGA